MNHHYIKNVATLKLDADLCTGCGVCTEVCPQDVLKLEDNKAVIVDLNACMECGACETNCAFNAISVNAGTGCAAGLIKGALQGKPGTCNCGGGGCC